MTSPLQLTTANNLVTIDSSMLPVVLCQSLMGESDETKLRLSMAAVTVRNSVVEMEKNAATICFNVFAIRQLAPDHWEQFCKDNFGFELATAKRYSAVGQMFQDHIGINGIALDDFKQLSQKALIVLTKASDANVVAFISDAKRTPLQAVDSKTVAGKLAVLAQGDADETKRRLAEVTLEFEQLRDSERASASALSQANETIAVLNEQVSTSEEEVIRLKKLANKAQPATIVEVVDSPQAATQDQRRRLIDQADEIATNDAKIRAQQAQLEVTTANVKRTEALYRRSDDVAEVLGQLSRDIGDLTVKYPRTLIDKLIVADARIGGQLTTLSDSLVSLSAQIRP